MPTLMILQDDGTEVLRLAIENVDPKKATVAILNALDELPKVRKPRSDTGKTRTPAAV